MRVIKALPVIAVLVLVLPMAVLFLYDSFSALAPMAPSIKGLPPETRIAERELKKRLQAEFPPGASEADLIERLYAEGFAVHSPEGGKEGIAELVRRGSTCNVEWTIWWNRSPGGKLASVDGTVGAVCP